MNFLCFWIAAMVIIGSSMADEELASQNEVWADDDATVEGEQEGRQCPNCHGGYSQQQVTHEQVHVQPSKGFFPGIPGLGLGGIGLLALPLIGLNIAAVVLLAIILKHLAHITDGIHSSDYGPAYTGYTTYQAFDDGGAANAFGSANSFGSHYRRTSDQSRGFADPSTLEVLANIVKKSIDKYSQGETEE